MYERPRPWGAERRECTEMREGCMRGRVPGGQSVVNALRCEKDVGVVAGRPWGMSCMCARDYAFRGAGRGLHKCTGICNICMEGINAGDTEFCFNETEW